MSRIPNDLRLQWSAFFYVDDKAMPEEKEKGLLNTPGVQALAKSTASLWDTRNAKSEGWV